MVNRKRISMPDLTGPNWQGNCTVPDILMLYIKQDFTLCKECTWVTVEQRVMAEDRGRMPYEHLYEPGTSSIGSMELLFSEEARERDTPEKVEDSGSELGTQRTGRRTGKWRRREDDQTLGRHSISAEQRGRQN
jgi:hypothetical protein